jgi:hypothetical protein
VYLDHGEVEMTNNAAEQAKRTLIGSIRVRGTIRIRSV